MTGYSPAVRPEVWMDHVVIDQRRVAEGFLKGSLDEQERETFARHLEQCEECQDRVALARLWLRPASHRGAAGPIVSHTEPLSTQPVPVLPSLGVSIQSVPLQDTPLQGTLMQSPLRQTSMESTLAPAGIAAPPADPLPVEPQKPILPVAQSLEIDTAEFQQHAPDAEREKSASARQNSEPLVTRVVVRPDEAARDSSNFGEMLARRLETRNTETPATDPPEASLANAAVEASGDDELENAHPWFKNQFTTWQLVVLGILLGLLLMAIPAAYFLVQIRRTQGH